MKSKKKPGFSTATYLISENHHCLGSQEQRLSTVYIMPILKIKHQKFEQTSIQEICHLGKIYIQIWLLT